MKMKKLGGLLSIAIFVVSLAGCGQVFSPAMTIDGTEISGGMYLLQQYNAYDKAKSEVEDTSKDVLSQKVDDVNAKKWIHDETLKSSKEYVAVQKLAEEHGVTLSDDDVSMIESALSSWDSSGSFEAYAENGIGKDTFYDFLENQTLKNNLFDKLYKEDGDQFVTDEELKTLYNEKYAILDTITIPLYEQDGVTRVNDETKKQIEDKTQEIVNELQSGAKTPDTIKSDIADLYALSGSTFDESTNAVFTSTTVTLHPKEDDVNSYSEEFLETVANEPFNTYGMTVVDDEDAQVYEVLLYQKTEPLTDEEEFASQRDSLLSDVKDDDFTDLLDTTADTYTVKQRALSEWYYSPKNIVYFSRQSTATQ